MLLSPPAFVQRTPTKANGSLRQPPNPSSAGRQAAGRVLVWRPRWKHDSANNSDLMQSEFASLHACSRGAIRTSYRTFTRSRCLVGCVRRSTEWKATSVQATHTRCHTHRKMSRGGAFSFCFHSASTVAGRRVMKGL